jgi:hypothetical protein
MAKKTQESTATRTISKPHIKRKARHEKKKRSQNKKSKNYKKPYKSQGRA